MTTDSLLRAQRTALGARFLCPRAPRRTRLSRSAERHSRAAQITASRRPDSRTKAAHRSVAGLAHPVVARGRAEPSPLYPSVQSSHSIRDSADPGCTSAAAPRPTSPQPPTSTQHHTPQGPAAAHAGAPSCHPPGRAPTPLQHAPRRPAPCARSRRSPRALVRHALGVRPHRAQHPVVEVARDGHRCDVDLSAQRLRDRLRAHFSGAADDHRSPGDTPQLVDAPLAFLVPVVHRQNRHGCVDGGVAQR